MASSSPNPTPSASIISEKLIKPSSLASNTKGIVVNVCVYTTKLEIDSGYNLFKDMAITSREPNQSTKPCLYNVEESIFPPPPNGPFLSPHCTSNKDESIHRRNTFSGQKLDKLKASVAAKSSVKNPLRNEVVSALLFKSFAATVKANSGNPFQPWVMTQIFDLREQIGFPPNSIGNIVTVAFISILTEEEIILSNIVTEMRKEKQHVCSRDNVRNNLLLEEFLELESKERTFFKTQENPFHFSSLVKFPLNGINFGCGKPAKVSIPNGPNNRLIILVGNLSGGIDAFVSLREQVMSVFEHDVELLKFAIPVPNF